MELTPMSTKSNKIFFLGLSLIAVMLSACSSTAPIPTKAPAQNVTIQLSWLHQSQFSGIYAAIDQSYYTDDNLNVKVNVGGISDKGYIDPMALVASGQADFGMASTNEVMKSRAQGQMLVAIASTLQRSPRAFISLKKKNIQRPQDLVGKRVAYRSDDNSVYLAILKAQNIDRKSINEITDSTKFTIDALINDQIDVIPAFLDNEPVLLAQKGYETNAILASDYGIETYENLIFTRQDLIDKNPDLVRRVLNATLRGYRYAVDNPNPAADLALKYDPKLDSKTLRASISYLIPLFNPPGSKIGMMKANVWTNAYRLLIDQGILTQPQPVEKAYTLTFLKSIYP